MNQKFSGKSLYADLYRVSERSDLRDRQKLKRIISKCMDYIGADNGHIEKFESDEHKIIECVGLETDKIQKGSVIDKSKTFCRITEKKSSQLSIENAEEQGFEDDPAYKTHGIECYIGSKIMTDKGVYGTLCFLSVDKKSKSFTSSEQMLIESATRLAGDIIRNNPELKSDGDTVTEANEKYQSIIQSAPNGIMIVEKETERIAETNEEMYNITGQKRDEIVGGSLGDMFVSSDSLSNTIRDTDNSNDTIRKNKRGDRLHAKTEDGELVPVEISTSEIEINGISYYQIFVSDISDRLDRLRELEVKTRAIDEAPIGIAIATSENGKPLKYVNDEFEDLTGYGQEEIIGLNCSFLQGKNTSDATVSNIRKALQNENKMETDVLNYSQSGREFWNRLTISPIYSDSDLTHYIGFQKDVTQRKRKHRLIKVQNRILRHNIRNRMTIILGYADMISEEANNEAIVDKADKIISSSNDLINIGEKSQKVKPVSDIDIYGKANAKNITEEVIRDLKNENPTSENDIRIVGPENKRTEININKDSLQTVLKELGENAIEHGQGDITYEIDVKKDETRIGVVDQGGGMNDKEKNVLEIGIETPLEHGSGIGLWMVSWIVTGVGGKLEVDNKEESTEISVHIPNGNKPVEKTRTSSMGTKDIESTNPS